LLQHRDEITARPARTWYQTETQKKEIRAAGRELVKREEQSARNDSVVGGRGNTTSNGSATDKLRQLANSDDYREEDKNGKKAHQMSRKKRRRLEALKELEHDETNKDERQSSYMS
jgi:ATP-dependent RNA helicase DDX27